MKKTIFPFLYAIGKYVTDTRKKVSVTCFRKKVSVTCFLFFIITSTVFAQKTSAEESTTIIAEAYYYINRIGEQGCEVSTIVKNPVFKKFTSNNGNVSYNWDGQVKNNFYSIMHIEFKDTIADNKETKQALAVKYLDWLKNKFRFTSINDYIVGYNYPQKDWQAWGVSAYFKDENNPGGIRYAHAKCWVSQNFATILILSRKDELFNEADEQAFLDGFRHSTLIANYPETPFH